MPELQLVPATREDEPSIKALIREVRINPLGLDWRRFLVIKDITNNELIGCGQIKPHRDGSRELASIAVRSKYRNQGFASRIIKALLIQDSGRPLYLTCRARLGGFYSKFGFRSIARSEMPRYFKMLHRLASLFNRQLKKDDQMLVMRLD